MTAPEMAIVARDLCKSFSVPVTDRPRLDRRLVPSFRRRTRTLTVLDGITFDVARGEGFGVVGRNGAGKTTLLKLLAGVYEPDSGSLRVGAGTTAFTDRSAGFSPELSVRENTVMKGIMLGLARDKVRARVDAILDFAELRDFADAELRTLSAGMRARLAFGVMIEADPEILLIDEMLSVGDAVFRDKCADVFRRHRERGRTLVIATHATRKIEGICDRAMLLEGAGIASLGEPKEVALAYDAPALAGRAARRGRSTSGLTPDDPRVRARLSDLSVLGARGDAFPRSGRRMSPIVIRADVEVIRPIPGPHVRVEVRDEDGCVLAPPPIPLLASDAARLRRGDRRRLRLELEDRLMPGTYALSCELTKLSPRGQQVPVSAVSTLALAVGDPRTAREDPAPGRELVDLDCKATLEPAAVREVA